MAPSLELYPSKRGTPNRSVNAALSGAAVSGPRTNFREWSRSWSVGGVARMWATARPTVLQKVAPDARTSGRKAEAENRRRSTRVDPPAIQGKTADSRALPWKSGMAE
jgi:hypothetical protein